MDDGGAGVGFVLAHTLYRASIAARDDPEQGRPGTAVLRDAQSAFACPLLDFVAELQSSIDELHRKKGEDVSQEALAEEVLTHELELVKQGEEDNEGELAVQEHAKQRLALELAKIEGTIKQLGVRKEELANRKAIISASLQQVVSAESAVRMAVLQTTKPEKPGEEGQGSLEDEPAKINEVLWLLKNPSIEEGVVVQGLHSFVQYCESLVEDALPAPVVCSWLEVLRAMLHHMGASPPRLILLELRVLTEVMRRCNNQHNVHLMAPSAPPGSEVTSSPLVREFLECNGLQLIIRSLSSVNDDIRAEAAGCVVVACSTNPIKQMFGQLGGIQALVELLQKSVSEIVLTQTLMALWNQAMADPNKALIRTCNGLGAVVNMLQVDNEAILENATIALGYLTRDDQNKIAIRECDGIEKLVATLYYPNESIQSKAAGALWNCASNAENKVYIRQLGGISALIELLTSQHDSVQENAAGGLWNCAVDTENKKLVRELGGLSPLIGLLDSPNLAIVENASGTMWNCAAVPDNRSALRKLHGLEPLLKLLWSPNENIQENAAGAIRNCSFNDLNKAAYRELGGINMFVQLLDRTCFNVLEKIISTLLICSINPQNKDVIQQCDGFPKLLDCLTHPEKCIREKALGILRNCSTTAENRTALIRAGGIPRLVAVLGQPPASLSPTLKEYAAATLWNVARDEHSKSAAREEGALEALLQLLDDETEGVVENAAGSLLSLTINEKNRDHVRHIGGIHKLVSLLSSSNEFILENVVGALKNCTANNEANQVLVRELGGLEPLIGLLPNPNDNVKRECILCLKNMASNEENNLKIGDLEGVSQLVQLVQVEQSTELIRKVAAFALQTLAKCPPNRAIIDKEMTYANSNRPPPLNH